MHAPRLEYSLYPESPNTQRICVDLRAPVPESGQADLRFARWTPGSYKIRDYARHLLSAKAWVDEEPVRIFKVGLAQYRVEAPAGRALRVQFTLLAMDDSVRGAWLDPGRGHFEGAAIFPCLEQYAAQPLRLELRPPAGREHWRVATALPAAQTAGSYGWGWYEARHWRHLVDHPLLMGPLEQLQYSVADCEHSFSNVGSDGGFFDRQRLQRDCARICETQIRAMGGSPNERYHFLLRVGPAGDGGLEHETSSLLAAGAGSLPQFDADHNRGYERLLGLISHEYFHLWNVKRIRPQAVYDSPLDLEAPFPDLWAYEGVTAYVDDWFLRRSNTRSVEDYLRVLGESLTRLQRTPGRHYQSLVEASEDAWIRLYQPAPHLPLSTVSYYLKGAMVALALDLTLRLESDGELDLIGLLRRQYAQWQDDPSALAPHALEALTRELCPAPAVARLMDDCVHGRADPDFAPLLAAFGLQAQRRPASGLNDAGGPNGGRALRASLGLRFEAGDGNRRVALAEPESAAARAGVISGDEFLGVDGSTLSLGELEALLRSADPGREITLHWLHDGRLHKARVQLDPPAEDRWEVRLDPQADAEARARRAAWLGPEAA